MDITYWKPLPIFIKGVDDNVNICEELLYLTAMTNTTALHDNFEELEIFMKHKLSK